MDNPRPYPGVVGMSTRENHRSITFSQISDTFSWMVYPDGRVGRAFEVHRAVWRPVFFCYGEWRHQRAKLAQFSEQHQRTRVIQRRTISLRSQKDRWEPGVSSNTSRARGFHGCCMRIRPIAPKQPRPIAFNSSISPARLWKQDSCWKHLTEVQAI